MQGMSMQRAGGDAADPQLAARVAVLEHAFTTIAHERMAGLPVLNPNLSVEAIGFERVAGAADEAGHALGILATPWFMSLVWLPLSPSVAGRADGGVPAVSPDQVGPRTFGEHTFDFMPNWQSGLGAFESCSLVSPMDEFASQADVRAIAVEILRVLRTARDRQDVSPQRTPARMAGAPLDRRRFLFGGLSAAEGIKT
ncbi:MULTISPECIES: [NiFe]-hydrogenase assembly chaperone HybE [Paraburkholderia]|uniref:[NiFe]-hydrogenase assembly, chaperone, HybE n=3 Tax=Paraburkholderia TaxID=1822464 RepID=A0A248VYA1_9BURK|nr:MULTISPECIES: [NiFe]-hydrogenase assembly chaperone HybE [Paraburkholderia]ASW04026.1 [NiFe]-hydrogenase assembly, chaperone, HybE [Paraburkholderia aromaticivorans]CAB3738568.1 hypothetical protein LMG22037_06243 [Paraburkholderia phenoliruptrix]